MMYDDTRWYLVSDATVCVYMLLTPIMIGITMLVVRVMAMLLIWLLVRVAVYDVVY